MDKIKAIFLDRDGTIIKDKGYMYRPEDIEFTDNAIDALKIFQRKYQLVVVTNQSGIGRGHFNFHDYEIFNQAFLEKLSDGGVRISGSLHCPHSPDANCDCRKPNTGLVKEWLEKNNLELDTDNSYVIGDKMSDIEFADNLSVEGILIKSPSLPSHLADRGESSPGKKRRIVENLYKATEIIL